MTPLEAGPVGEETALLRAEVSRPTFLSTGLSCTARRRPMRAWSWQAARFPAHIRTNWNQVSRKRRAQTGWHLNGLALTAASRDNPRTITAFREEKMVPARSSE